MSEVRIRVAAVSYLNTKPLLYGFRHHPVMKEMILTLDYPSRIAAQLLSGRTDLALVPVAVLPEMEHPRIIGDYCIGAEGPVASVALFSEVPIDRIRRIFLDYQSRTSSALIRVLASRFWDIHPEFVQTTEEFEYKIRAEDAGLLIGDRALARRPASPFIYDLAEAWIALTGLPFVFAAWVANRELPPDFISGFNEATGSGLDHIPDLVRESPSSLIDLNTYFTQHISYRLTPSKRQGLALFLDMLGAETGKVLGIL